MRVDVKADVRAVEKALARINGAMPRAVTRALNAAIRKAQSEAVKGVAREIGIKQKTARGATKLRLANRRRLAADVTARGRRIPLVEMGGRQTRQGVTYKSRGKRQLIKGAFIAKMKSGHVGAFKRRYYGQNSKRLPIDEKLGPSIPLLFVQDHIAEAMDKAARQVWGKELARQVNLARREAGL